jgi:acetylornithine deacetylase/succinyl-diaminopimelate desuccinylase-like protein
VSSDKALEILATLEGWITDKQVELCSIPAPSFEEEARARWFLGEFQRLGLERARIDEEGNVLAEITGAAPGRERGVVAVSAHLDTVFPRSTRIEIRRENGRLLGPGVTDNGAGLAALLAVARAAKESGWRGRDTLLLVANVGEEGEGNLRGVRRLFAANGNGSLRARLRGLLVVDGAGVDQITNVAVGSRRFQVSVEGPGGHSWSDFGTPNPVHALAAVAAKLAVASLPADPKTTCTVAEFRGGASINSIPASAFLKVDIRSTAPEEIARLSAVLEEAVIAAVDAENRRAPRARLTQAITTLGERPAAALRSDARILEVLREVDAELGITAQPRASSTDANIPLSLGLEAVAIGAGGCGGGTHTLGEWFDPAQRLLGVKRILLAAFRLAQ